MHRKNAVPAYFFTLAVAFVVFFSSCTDTRQAIYFNNLNEGALRTNTVVPESVIQKNDLLSLSISSPNLEASALFNPTSGAASGILVDNDGNIQVPLLGYVKAAGFTKDQLKANIIKQLLDKKLLVDPVVAIRFLNFRITVLGEVGNPQVVQVPSEKITLLEAIGTAGDMTLDARRDNVLVIREENGANVAKRINLNSTEIFNSPYYYLRTNDIVYVEPRKARITRANGNQVIPLITGILGIAIGIVSVIVNAN